MKNINEILLQDSYKLMPRQEVKMKNLKIAKTRFVTMLMSVKKEHGYNMKELNEKELTVLRDMVDEYFPTTIQTASVTASGGVSRSETVLKKAA